VSSVSFSYHEDIHGGSSPSRSLIIPKMPAILMTLLAPVTFASLIRRSPEGRSSRRVGALGFEGEVKA